ncbi:ankyrin repeat and SOCS box protein 13 isoform X2 [Sagmatias obliquidens]|uniref:Ankyrin repeat and SOCS box protein 13 isoform X2 n=1 Tax=Tursiops truncatus TaxID=9739 RepID=A0A2U4B6Q2_TURTR|nr:ankyrin repeat and SOCS box protein 13 isoform X2 [Tursiops truncatus]XP_026977322.1 ankyrin repeat and SOCS box protein 13 isoform X2 [Lagenorhynchus obliquidens]
MVPSFWVERTPVHEAAQRGETRQLQQLIESGACVNQVMVDSITPLHAASLQGQAQCVQLLLAAGAQVDARNIDGSTPLCDACASGSIECVKLLLSHGAKVNPPLYTASPLHEACMSGSSECVRLLIDVGANLEAHDCHFGTPLHVACAREHLDCVKMLLNAGANVNAAKLHETALHHAAKVKNVDLIEMLIQFGGNIYARDNRGRKPSDYTWSSSASAKCLEHYEKTPLSLSQLCRLPNESYCHPKFCSFLEALQLQLAGEVAGTWWVLSTVDLCILWIPKEHLLCFRHWLSVLNWLRM